MIETPERANVLTAAAPAPRVRPVGRRDGRATGAVLCSGDEKKNAVEIAWLAGVVLLAGCSQVPNMDAGSAGCATHEGSACHRVG